MNTNQKTAVALVVLVAAAALYLLAGNQRQEDIGDKTPPLIYTQQEVIQILKTNTDAADYINKNRDYSIKITPLSKQDILEGEKATNFREVYQNLTLENNRYLKADLMNNNGEGLVTVVDMKTRAVVKLYGLRLIKFG